MVSFEVVLTKSPMLKSSHISRLAFSWTQPTAIFLSDLSFISLEPDCLMVVHGAFLEDLNLQKLLWSWQWWRWMMMMMMIMMMMMMRGLWYQNGHLKIFYKPLNFLDGIRSHQKRIRQAISISNPVHNCEASRSGLFMQSLRAVDSSTALLLWVLFWCVGGSPWRAEQWTLYSRRHPKRASPLSNIN